MLKLTWIGSVGGSSELVGYRPMNTPSYLSHDCMKSYSQLSSSHYITRQFVDTTGESLNCKDNMNSNIPMLLPESPINEVVTLLFSCLDLVF